MPYGTIADWRSYALDRGNAAPTDATDADANAALVRASDYVRTRYVARYALDDAAEAVIEATYIAASIELATPGFFAATYTPAQAKVLTEVKGIKWSLVGGGGRDAMTPVSTLIEGLLVPQWLGVGVMVV